MLSLRKRRVVSPIFVANVKEPILWGSDQWASIPDEKWKNIEEKYRLIDECLTMEREAPTELNDAISSIAAYVSNNYPELDTGYKIIHEYPEGRYYAHLTIYDVADRRVGFDIDVTFDPYGRLQYDVELDRLPFAEFGPVYSLNEAFSLIDSVVRFCLTNYIDGDYIGPRYWK